MWSLTETLRHIEEAGDESVVWSLIVACGVDTAGGCLRLKEAVTSLQSASVKAEAHAMQGSASQMGADALAAQCRAIEAGAPARNWTELEFPVKQAELGYAE